MKLLHFDSHPDLGVVHGSHIPVQRLPSGSPVSVRCAKLPDVTNNRPKRPKTSRNRVKATHKGSTAIPPHYSIMNVYRKLDIASWVLPLVQAGHVDTVYWIAGMFFSHRRVTYFARSGGLS